MHKNRNVYNWFLVAMNATSFCSTTYEELLQATQFLVVNSIAGKHRRKHNN